MQSIEPPLLAPGTVVPGFVSNGGVAYFRVATTDFNLGDEVVVESSVGTVRRHHTCLSKKINCCCVGGDFRLDWYRAVAR